MQGRGRCDQRESRGGSSESQTVSWQGLTPIPLATLGDFPLWGRNAHLTTNLLRMDVELVDRFSALLALAALAGTLGIVFLSLGGRLSPALARWNEGLKEAFGDWVYWLVFLVALVSMLGSLYYSDVVGYPPCSLCWYQRIAMYPLVVIMGIAAAKRDTGIRKYVLPLMVIGAILAIYQYIIGYIPDAEILGCSLDVSCTERYIWEFGFVDFPLMSFVGFSLMISLMLWASPGDQTESDE